MYQAFNIKALQGIDLTQKEVSSKSKEEKISRKIGSHHHRTHLCCSLFPEKVFYSVQLPT